MTHPAITSRNLCKSYRLGSGLVAGSTFREAISGTFNALLRRKHAPRRDRSGETFHALQDVSFEVGRGQVVGVIGHNGAGKSTLLKILSRITDPTAGQAVIHGRVASLLEVGTGFHNELTGRENIYLNGSILGMTRQEIRQRFDEIVDFSGVEKFLDLPVKRYSSGMAVRLAFAVAAHLRPEILLVDEVLAVGDVAFQRKCLGKMQDVVQHDGRTVLFVSHNMDSIRAMCSQVVVLDRGRTVGCMPVEEGVRQYYGILETEQNVPLLQRERSRRGGQRPVFEAIHMSVDGHAGNIVPCGGTLEIDIDLTNLQGVRNGELGVVVQNDMGQRVVLFQSQYHANLILSDLQRTRVRCSIPNLNLAPGTYHIDLALFNSPDVVDYVERAGQFEVVFADLFGTGKIPDAKQGYVVMPCDFRLVA